MRVLNKRLVGLGGQAIYKPWSHFSSTRANAEAQLQIDSVGTRSDADASFLQLLSQTFVPSGNESSPMSRPVLANLPAAADLMERAVPQTASTQPLYDLATFLTTSYPQAGVRPRNPGYDWSSWARNNVAQADKTLIQEERDQYQLQLALLLQMDAHMQLPKSREALLRIAKLELAHLWYYQQQQQQQPTAASRLLDTAGAIPAGNMINVGRGDSEQTRGNDRGQGAGMHTDASASLESAVTPMTSSPKTAAVHQDEDDIFAAADRRARARTEERQLRETEQQQLAAQHVVTRDPLSSLSPDMQLRLRELQRRAEAYSQRTGAPLAVVIRDVGEAFGQHVSYAKDVDGDGGFVSGGAVKAASSAPGAFGLGVSSLARGLNQRKMVVPADAQLVTLDTSSPSLTYWADHPLLSYTDNVVALAARETAARRLKTPEDRDGSSSSAEAVTSLSASLARPRAATERASRSVSQAPETPVLDLLLDHLKVKYLDILHAWEVEARLRQAAEHHEREVAQQRANLTIQVGKKLPVALRDELARSWATAVAAFRPDVLAPVLQPTAGPMALSMQQAAHQALAVPLDWNRAAKLLDEEISVRAAAASTAGVVDGAARTAGDLSTVVQHVMAPVLAAAAARHQALLARREGRGSVDMGKPLPSARSTGAVTSSTVTSSPFASSSPASTVCVRETVVLDAASAFEDSSQDCKVSLELDVDRLASLEAALGGAWSVRFLERLLSQPSCDSTKQRRPVPGGSMAGRARRSPAAWSALIAKVYPVDVERSFCRRTRTATLSTARYASREANRKLLLEHYTELLRVAVKAVQSAGPRVGKRVE